MCDKHKKTASEALCSLDDSENNISFGGIMMLINLSVPSISKYNRVSLHDERKKKKTQEIENHS